MRLPKDLLTGAATKPRLFLCETDKQKICQLETTDMQGSFKFNAYSELSFTVGRTYTNIITGETNLNPFYDKIEGLRLVYLEGIGYFELQDPEDTSDGIRETKSMTAYSLEYTLSQKYLENLNINTGTSDSVEVINQQNGSIIPVALYNPSRPDISLLHIVLEKIYGWKIGHIDASLQSMSRTFEISRVSVYDFIVQDICDKFNCFAVFDTINNTINLYAEASVYKIESLSATTNIIQLPNVYRFDSIGSITINGYKTSDYQYEQSTGKITFNKSIEKGSFIEVTDGSQEKWQTDIYVSFDNLAQEVNVSYSTDDIKTVLTVKGSDDLDIREVNMGLPYIIDLSYYHNVDWMGQDLYDAYTAYLQKCNDKQASYKSNSETMLELSNMMTYEDQRLSLQYSIAGNVTSTTAGTYYVRGGTAPNYYYKEVKLPDEYSANVEHYYTLSDSGLNETKFSNLYTALKTYYISQDVKDVSEIEKLIDSFVFVEHYTLNTMIQSLKTATTLNQKDTAVTTFLDEMWDQMGLTPLKTLYYTPYEQVKISNVDAGWSDTSNANYWAYYPITLVLNSLNKEMQDRENKITDLQKDYNVYQSSNIQIANSIVMANHFTLEQLIRLSAFLREDEYTDENFVKTETDTIALAMRTKQELLECGRIELSKLSAPKLQFSMDMANIYALPEFEPMINQFQLGNIIKIKLRDARTESVVLVGDGTKTIFTVPTALDEVKEIYFSHSQDMSYEYNSKAGTLTFNKAPAKDEHIEIVLVKYYIKQSRLLQVDINFEDLADFSCEFGELTSLKTPSSIHADLLAGAISAGKTVASSQSYWNQGTDVVSALALQVQQGLLDATTIIKAIDGNQGVEIDAHGIHLRKYDPVTGIIDPKEGWIINNQFLYSNDNFKTTKSVFGEYTIGNETKWGLLAEAVMAGYIAGCIIEGGTINIGNGTFVVDSNGQVTMNASNNVINGYATTSALSVTNANLKLAQDAIEAEVTRASGVESTLRSQINMNANSITSKVEADDFGTLIEQNYDHVKIAWNKNSNYIKFEDGTMNIYTSASNSNDTRLMKLAHNGTWYYHQGTTIGKIGTNTVSDSSSYKGLVFDLEDTASYMCWAARDNAGDSGYNVKLIYHHNNNIDKKGLHFRCDTYADGYLYLTDDYGFISYTSGTVGYNGPMVWVNSDNVSTVKIDGTTSKFEVLGGTTFTIYNNVTMDVYSDIDMHNYDILNQSDVRLKTNIQDTQVNALDIINRIEMKEFDWIENNKHEDIGIIAQQLQEIMPDLVYENTENGTLSIKINKFVPYLIKAVQELSNYITNGVSTFSMGWRDPYNIDEKQQFVQSIQKIASEELEEAHKDPILIPINEAREN